MIKKWLICICMTLLLSTALKPDQTNANGPGELFSESAILIDAKSGNILFEKEKEKVMYPASITKIVTAIIAIEEGDLEDIVTISKNARNQDGSRVYLLEGEKVTLWKLVQGLLINSGNDAGTAIAEHFDGNEKGFAKRMNKFVEEKMGVENTNFQNPHGLFDPNHVTTAQDMAKITQYAMENEAFRKLVGTKEIEWVGEGWETTLYNHHRLLWDYEGASGVKNGYVPESGHTLVTSAEREGTELIVVTLKAASKYYSYQDTMKLLNYGFQNFETHEISQGKVISDSSGDNYLLAKDVYVAKQEEEEVALTINKNKELVIKVGSRENVVEDVLVKPNKNDISPIASPKGMNSDKSYSASDEPTETKSSLIPMALLLAGLFLIIFLVGWNQKRRRRKIQHERYAETLTYSKRSKYHR